VRPSTLAGRREEIIQITSLCFSMVEFTLEMLKTRCLEEWPYDELNNFL